MPIAAAVVTVVLALFPACPQQPQPAPAPPSAPAPTIAAVIYATRGSDQVHLLSLPDLQPLHSYDAGAGAHELAISADGRWALGSAYGGPGPGHQPVDNRVFVLDLPAGKRHRMIDLGASKRPNDLAFLGTTATAVATTEVPAQLLRLDAETGAVQAFPLTHQTNHMLALAPDHRSCFVSHVMPGGVTRFDLTTGTTSAHGALPVGAEGIACTGSGEELRLWIGCNRAGKLVVVDGATLKVLHELERPGFPLRVKAAPGGARVAVSCPMSGEVVLYDGKDPQQATTIDLRAQLEAKVQPTSIAFSPDGTQLLVVANGETDHVVAIDVATAKVTARVVAAGPIADALAAGRVQAPPKPAGDVR
jgi:YVTN family beta-propeller protein